MVINDNGNASSWNPRYQHSSCEVNFQQLLTTKPRHSKCFSRFRQSNLVRAVGHSMLLHWWECRARGEGRYILIGSPEVRTTRWPRRPERLKFVLSPPTERRMGQTGSRSPPPLYTASTLSSMLAYLSWVERDPPCLMSRTLSRCVHAYRPC